MIIVDILFIKGDSEPLDYSPLHDPLDNRRFQHRPTVVYSHVLQNVDLTGLNIYVYDRDMCSGGSGGVRVQASLLIRQPLRRRQPVALDLQRSARSELSQRERPLRRA